MGQIDFITCGYRTVSLRVEKQHTGCAAARKLDRSLQNSDFIQECETTEHRKLWTIMNTVSVTDHKAVQQASEAPIATLSSAFGDIVHDAARSAVHQVPQGPLPQSALTSFQPVSMQNIEKCLVSVYPHKASGSDSMTGLFLLLCASAFAPHFAKIFKTSMLSGVVPTCFKLSYVSSLFKSVTFQWQLTTAQSLCYSLCPIS